MSDSLYDVLRPHFDSSSLANNVTIPQPSDPVTAKYLSRLPKLDLAALQTSEPQSLAQSSHSTLLALRLSRRDPPERSYPPQITSVISASDSHPSRRTAKKSEKV